MGIYGVYMKILFIKSTSIQHLALSFEKVRSLPPPTHPLDGCPALLIKEGRGVVIDVLAHPHTVDSLKGFGFINRIITYNHTGNFNPFNILVKDIRKEGYDVIVVPFNNLSGAGYENVMAVAVCTGARHIVTCNRTGDTKVLDVKKALLRVVKGYSYYPIALLMTAVLSMIGILTIFILSLRTLAKQIFFSATLTPLKLLRRFAPRNDS